MKIMLSSGEDVTLMQTFLNFAWKLLNIEFYFAGIKFTLWSVIVASCLVAFVVWIIGSYLNRE